MNDPEHQFAIHALTDPGPPILAAVRSLEPHPPNDIDPRWDGHTAEIGRQCGAVSVSKWHAGFEPPRCPKQGVVLLHLRDSAFALCGGHFIKHRRGVRVPIHPELVLM